MPASWRLRRNYDKWPNDPQRRGRRLSPTVRIPDGTQEKGELKPGFGRGVYPRKETVCPT